MAIDLTNVAQAVPPPVGVQTVMDGNLATAPEVKPPPTGVTASMAPLIAEGVKLVKCVLFLTAAAIVLLLVFFAIFEEGERSKVARVYDQAVSEAVNVRPPNTRSDISLLVAELRRANDDSSWAMSPAETTDASIALKEIASIYLPTDEQKKDLATCVPIMPSTDANRATVLARCLNTITNLVPVTNDATARVKLLEEILKQADDNDQVFRTYWMQVSQMILMNIFFPLLTALLGYVFGTQQASKP
jgi:hypothetical protein